MRVAAGKCLLTVVNFSSMKIQHVADRCHHVPSSQTGRVNHQTLPRRTRCRVPPKPCTRQHATLSAVVREESEVARVGTWCVRKMRGVTRASMKIQHVADHCHRTATAWLTTAIAWHVNRSLRRCHHQLPSPICCRIHPQLVTASVLGVSSMKIQLAADRCHCVASSCAGLDDPRWRLHQLPRPRRRRVPPQLVRVLCTSPHTPPSATVTARTPLPYHTSCPAPPPSLLTYHRY